MNNISFLCPKCGSPHLMQVETAIHRYGNLNIEHDDQGELCIVEKEIADDLSGEVLGYRCMDCRYPDCAGSASEEGFKWKTLNDIVHAGALACPSAEAPIEHKCMVCFPDGTMKPLIVESPQSSPLTAEQRQAILHEAGHPNTCLITLADRGIKSFTVTNWTRIKRIKIAEIYFPQKDCYNTTD